MAHSSGTKIAKEDLPWLGVGVAKEHTVGDSEFRQLLQRNQALVQFVEYGGTTELGLDEDISQWAASGKPTTYHYLDVNLSDGSSPSLDWYQETANLAAQAQATWLCGDVGLWYYGQRAIKNIVLTHPILSRESARATADGVLALQHHTGYNCFPENPPSSYYLGDMHLLDFFAELSELANCWITLDCAHLTMYQAAHNHAPLTGLDNFPLDRIAEIHIAGGHFFRLGDQTYIMDSHFPQIPTSTWQIVEYLLPRAKNLRAICLEAEEQHHAMVTSALQQIHQLCKQANLPLLTATRAA